MSYLDGLFAGFSQLRVNGIALAFKRALNFVGDAVDVTVNQATGSLDITIRLPTSPSTTIPISDDGAGTVTVGSDPTNGIAVAFNVPNDDGSGNALSVDNSNGTTIHQWPNVMPSPLRLSSELGSAPVAPASGFVLYVLASDHKLYAKGRSGTVTALANP